MTVIVNKPIVAINFKSDRNSIDENTAGCQGTCIYTIKFPCMLLIQCTALKSWK